MKRNIIAIHLAAFLFGMTGILSTLIDADSDVITFGRAIFAVAVLSPILWLWRDPATSPKDANVSPLSTTKRWALCLVSGLILTIHWVTFFVSVKTAGVALATLGFSGFAAFITLIEAVVTPKRVTRTDWIRTVIVTAGLALMTPSLDLADASTYGFLMGLLSGFAFAAMAVFNSHWLANVNPIQVARNQNVIVLLLTAAWALPALGAISLVSWFWLALLGVFCTGLSHSLFVFSLARMRVNVAGLVIALEPVYAIAGAWLLFHETPSLRTIAGGLIIICAIVGINYTKTRQAP